MHYAKENLKLGQMVSFKGNYTAKVYQGKVSALCKHYFNVETIAEDQPHDGVIVSFCYNDCADWSGNCILLGWCGDPRCCEKPE